MARRRKSKRPGPDLPEQQPAPPVQAPEPVDVVDGIPDRSAKPVRWKIVALALIFILWVAFLIYCGIAGAP